MPGNKPPPSNSSSGGNKLQQPRPLPEQQPLQSLELKQEQQLGEGAAVRQGLASPHHPVSALAPLAASATAPAPLAALPHGALAAASGPARLDSLASSGAELQGGGLALQASTNMPPLPALSGGGAGAAAAAAADESVMVGGDPGGMAVPTAAQLAAVAAAGPQQHMLLAQMHSLLSQVQQSQAAQQATKKP